uniref:Tryptophan synthase alpha subunit n=1 Tax=Symphyocladia marchantioides TaxID=88360 RepID=UPI0022FD5B84|nr:Tryptophan synthase alpha subunit [Symphyocladia marchantioides]WAX03819.1 Tryptophan synthase alpha subunit [Symphyocladia marchantioides]
MNLISQILQEKRQNSKCALIPFVTAGYPNIELTIETLCMLDKKGADIIELGIPYSDALADGPLIQHASKLALDNGIYIDQVLDLLSKVESRIRVPIIIFTYYNPILVRGLSRFIREISQFGVKGLIIPDLPIEETDYLIYLCDKYQLELVLFISPTSSKNRIKNILSKAPGCIYLVSSTGVTGIRDSINAEIGFLSNNINLTTDKLVMLGFGVSSPIQVSNILKSTLDVNGIVVGSAFTKILSHYSYSNASEVIQELGCFCNEIKLLMI